MAWKIFGSLIGALFLVVILTHLFPLIPEDGPFGIWSLVVDTAPFVIGSVVVGVGAVGLWVLNDLGGF